jgi:hypothetical protein
MQDKAHPSGPMHWTRGVRYVVPEGYTCIATEKNKKEAPPLHRRLTWDLPCPAAPFFCARH